MKKFEHAIILLGGIIIAFSLIAVVLYHEAKQKRIEQERRNDLFILHNDKDEN